MADTVVGFKISIDGINTINDLNNKIKETQKVVDTAVTGTEEWADAYKKLGELKAEQTAIKKQQDDYNKSLLETNQNLGAYDKASAKLNRLRKEYKNLAIEGQTATEGAKALKKEIDGLDKTLKDADASVGQFQRNVGNYGSVFGGAGAKLDNFAENAGDVADKLGGIGGPASIAIKAMQGVGIAVRFALGPIGAIITIIALLVGAIKSFFTASEEGQDSLARFGAVFKAIFKTIQDAAAIVGGAIIKTIEAIGSSINTVLTIFGQANNDLRKNAEEAVKLAERVDALEARQRKNLVENAKREKEIAEAKDKAAQKDKFNAKERLSALDRAIQLEKEILAENTKIAQEKLNIEKKQNSLGKRTEEQKNREAELEAELIRQQTAFFEGTKRLQQARVSAVNEIASDEKALQEQQRRAFEEQKKKQEEIAAARKKFIEDEVKYREEAFKLTQSILDKTNKLVIDLTTDEFVKRRKLAQQAFQDELKANEETLKNQKKANEDRLKEAEKVFGANSEQYKKVLADNQTNELEILENTASQEIILRQKLTDELLKIDKDQTNKLIEENKKLYEKRKANIESAFNNEINILDTLLAQGIIKEEEYNQKVFELTKKRLEDELALNKKQLDDNIDLTKDEQNAIISQNISLNEELAKLEAQRTKNLKDESQKRKDIEQKELDDRWKTLDEKIQQAGQFTKLALDTLTGFAEAAEKKRLERIARDEEANQRALENLNERLQRATGLERRFLEQRIQSEEQNAERIAKEKEKIEKQSAKRKKATAIIESIINTALAVSSALATPPAPNVIAATIAGIAGAAQTAVIAAQPLAKGGVVGKGDEIVQFANGGKVTSKGNIKPLSNGDNVLATLKTGEIVLNEAQQRRIGYATLKKAQIPNFANGGMVGAPSTLIANANNSIATEQMRVNMIEEMISATNNRMDRLSVVYTATTDYEVEKSRNDKKTIKVNSTF